MQTFLWILAFIGVALIYPVPIITGKLGVSNNINAALKLAGIVLAVISLIILNNIGAFNH